MLQAINDHQNCVRTMGVERAMMNEPAQWIMSNSESPYGFIWCCSVLDLAPDRLRMVMNTIDIVQVAKDRLKDQSIQKARKFA